MKRDNTISICKGFAIILMVMQHAKCPVYVCDLMNLFHMPLFFFFSGWFIKTDPYEWNFKTVLLSIKKEILKLYIPFLTVSLIFLILHNHFVNIHLLDNYINSTVFKENLFNITFRFTNLPSEKLLGPLWFLRTLFFSSTITILIVYLRSCIRKNYINDNNSKIFILDSIIILILLTIITFIFLIYHIRIPILNIEYKETLGSIFMISGLTIKKSKIQLKSWQIIMMVFFLCIAPFYVKVNMLNITSKQLLPYIGLAICGILVIHKFSSSYTKHTKSNIFPYIGNHTLWILMLHLISFKLVIFTLIKKDLLPINELTSFPILHNTSQYWFIYTIIGITAPLLVEYILKNIIKSIKI